MDSVYTKAQDTYDLAAMKAAGTRRMGFSIGKLNLKIDVPCYEIWDLLIRKYRRTSPDGAYRIRSRTCKPREVKYSVVLRKWDTEVIPVMPTMRYSDASKKILEEIKKREPNQPRGTIYVGS